MQMEVSVALKYKVLPARHLAIDRSVARRWRRLPGDLLGMGQKHANASCAQEREAPSLRQQAYEGASPRQFRPHIVRTICGWVHAAHVQLREWQQSQTADGTQALNVWFL